MFRLIVVAIMVGVCITQVKSTTVNISTIDMTNFTVYDTDITALNVDIPLIAYKRSNPQESLEADLLEYEDEKNIVIYIHGYATRDLREGLEIKDALFKGTDEVNVVILLDWRSLSLPENKILLIWPPHYKKVATEHVPVVAERLKSFLIEKMNNRDNHIYLIGFSLGAHVAGVASRLANQSNPSLIVNRITALDPAGPIFEYPIMRIYSKVNTTYTLRKTDAKFVDVVHISEKLGMREDVGHLDIYVKQNECITPICAHKKAIKLYVSSLTRCSLITCPKDLFVGTYHYIDNYCNTTDVRQLSSLGYLAVKYEGRGSHFISVKTRFIRNWGFTGSNCSKYMNVYAPAKGRICKLPMNDCDGKPYLSVCRTFCAKRKDYTDMECTVKGLSLIKWSLENVTESVNVVYNTVNTVNRVEYQGQNECPGIESQAAIVGISLFLISTLIYKLFNILKVYGE